MPRCHSKGGGCSVKTTAAGIWCTNCVLPTKPSALPSLLLVLWSCEILGGRAWVPASEEGVLGCLCWALSHSEFLLRADGWHLPGSYQQCKRAGGCQLLCPAISVPSHLGHKLAHPVFIGCLGSSAVCEKYYLRPCGWRGLKGNIYLNCSLFSVLSLVFIMHYIRTNKHGVEQWWISLIVRLSLCWDLSSLALLALCICYVWQRSSECYHCLLSTYKL